MQRLEVSCAVRHICVCVCVRVVRRQRVKIIRTFQIVDESKSTYVFTKV